MKHVPNYVEYGNYGRKNRQYFQDNINGYKDAKLYYLHTHLHLNFITFN